MRRAKKLCYRMIGDFSDFQLYLFTLSKKIHIIENSIHRLTDSIILPEN